MAQVSQWCFTPFRLDLSNACLWRNDHTVALPPKPFAILTYLVEHAGQLVTKEALLDAVWPDMVVGDAVLKVCIAQIRRALGEAAQSPTFIMTVHRRGYRFIAPVSAIPPSQPDPVPVTISPHSDTAFSFPLVERDAIFADLHNHLAQVRQGTRQVVFLAGEAGIGKTSIVSHFTAQVTTGPAITCVAGQCIDHYGAGEAYLPVLEALGRLCRGPDGDRVTALLRQRAPTWLAQLPWLVTAEDREHLQQELLGTTRERMLRELTEVLETLTADHLLVLVLEDLHWSDYATLDLISLLAQRQESAQLFLIGTYRPTDVIVSNHPLRAVTQTLSRQSNCSDYPLSLLSEAGIASYLTTFVGAPDAPVAIARALHQRTGGNPLFLSIITQSLHTQGLLGTPGKPWNPQAILEAIDFQIPESLRSMIEQELDHLPQPVQQLLEAASVVGTEFTVAAVGAAVTDCLSEVEIQFEHLVRQRRFLHRISLDTSPDGTHVAHYGFIHSLYQHVTYERLGARQRAQSHQRIGAYLEAAYGSQTNEIAAELALHFTHGGDVRRAIPYLLQAAETSTERHAYRETIRHLTTGLKLLSRLSDTADRCRQELTLQMALGRALSWAKGYADPEVKRAYLRALELCEHVEETPQYFRALAGLQRFYFFRGQSQKARELSEELASRAQSEQEPEYRFLAYHRLGQVLLAAGELQEAHLHFDQGLAFYESLGPSVCNDLGLQSLMVSSRMLDSETLWLLGYPDQAIQISRAGLAFASSLPAALHLVVNLTCVTRLHVFRREWDHVQQQAEALILLCTEKDFPLWLSIGTILQGLALTVQGHQDEGLRRIQQGLKDHQHTGATRNHTYYLAILAEAYGFVGQPEEGLDTLAEALTLVETYGERWWEAELYRIKGELLLTPRGGVPASDVIGDLTIRRLQHADAAMSSFMRALEVAQGQQAKSLELRAAMSLSRLGQQLGQREAVYSVLTEIYAWFTEGLSTADLQDAGRILDTLSSRAGGGARFAAASEKTPLPSPTTYAANRS